MSEDLWKTHSHAIHPGHHYAWDCFTNTIYYAWRSGLTSKWLGVDVSSSGLLTSLPATSHLCHFLTFCDSLVAKKLEYVPFLFDHDYIGSDTVVIRIINLPFLYIWNYLDWMQLHNAFLNVLLPKLWIVWNRPRWTIGVFWPSLYITSWDVHSDRPSVAVPITKATSWQGLAQHLDSLCALALVIWIPNLRYNHRLPKGMSYYESQSGKSINMFVGYHDFWGFCSHCRFHTSMTGWLDTTMAVQAGLSKVESGLASNTWSVSILLTIDPKVYHGYRRTTRCLMLTIVVGA